MAGVALAWNRNMGCGRLRAMNTKAHLLLLLGLTFTLAACGSGATGSPSPAPITPQPQTPAPTAPPATQPPATPAPPDDSLPADPADISGRTFISVSVTEDGEPHPLVEGTVIRLSFEDGTISASAGCNSMFGSYTIEDGILVVDAMGMTEMGCAPALMAQDQSVAAFLGSRPAITLSGDDLTLTSETTTIQLLDREVAEPDQPLVGTLWTLESIITADAVSSVPLGATATIQFNEDGTVEIQPGCNSAGGSYTVDGDTITLSNIVTTDMACMGARGELESAVMGVISAGSVTYSIDSGSLTIMAGDRGLQFSAEVG